MTDRPSLTLQFRSYIDSRLEPGLVRFVCLTVLLLSLGLLVFSFVTAREGRTVFGPPLGADFAGFYTAGTILNRLAPDSERLYDFDFQEEVYHQVLPTAPAKEINPFVHPPFVAFLFGLLARLPYETALAVWLVLSVGLYLAGLAVAARACRSLPARDRLAVLLLALAFEPFIMECWLGGQLSTCGFFCIALALALDLSGRPFRSGLVLGLCFYKPTLLVLLLPMLVVGRRFRTLAGMTVTGLVLLGVSVLGVGSKNTFDYVQALLHFTGTATGGGLERKDWKFVDLNFFLRTLTGGPTPWNKVILLGLAAVPLCYLVPAWWKLGRCGDTHRRLVWAATICWTPVLNLYTGIYDTILVVLGLLLAADVLFRTRETEQPLPVGFRGLLALVFVVPWFSQPVARLTGFQPYTVVLVAVGAYLLVMVRRFCPQQGPSPAEPTGSPLPPA